MKIKIVWVGKTKDPGIQSLTAEYLGRITRFVPAEALAVGSEAALLKMLKPAHGPRPRLVLLDAGGKQLISEGFARFLDDHQNHSTQPLLFAVGPADGFSAEARRAASFVLSLGRMTLSHELARVVLLEQIYRGFTILKGHPYHLGH